MARRQTLPAAALICAAALSLSSAAQAQAGADAVKARQTYVDCLVGKMRTLGPHARTFEHAVYTSFLFCADERVAFTSSLAQQGYDDPEGVTKAVDLEVVKALVTARNAATGQPPNRKISP